MSAMGRFRTLGAIVSDGLKADIGSGTTELSNERVQLADIEPGRAIMIASQFEHGKAVLVGREAPVVRFVEKDQSTFDYEKDQGRFGRILGDDQCVRLAGGFVNEASGTGNPIMLQVSPIALQCVPADRPDMIVNAQLRTGQALQQDTEPA